MPTLISHALIGLAGSASLPRPPRRFWLLAGLCAVLPDLDVAGFHLGIPYAHPLGHRGFFHSLSFALLVGLTMGFLFLRRRQAKPTIWLGYGLLLALVTASHGIADACTNGGLGVALFSPFDQQRYFFASTPIAVSPLQPKYFLTGRMATVLLSEMLYIWLPLCGIVVASRLTALVIRWRRNAKRPRCATSMREP